MNYGTPSRTIVANTTFGSAVAGTEIALADEIMTVAASQDLKFLQAVALDATGNVIAAEQGEPAIGIMPIPVKTAAGETVTAQVIRAGVFDPEALVFDDSYATFAEKAEAFRGAPAPTNIILKRRF